jgi:hypothetical protein
MYYFNKRIIYLVSEQYARSHTRHFYLSFLGIFITLALRLITI